MQVDGVYQNGILKPLQPLNLTENERVVVAGAEPAPGLDEVRRRLSKIPGSMAADFIAEREDR